MLEQNTFMALCFTALKPAKIIHNEKLLLKSLTW